MYITNTRRLHDIAIDTQDTINSRRHQVYTQAKSPAFSILDSITTHTGTYNMSVIFVHIPKTAGTSLSEAIDARVGNAIRYQGYDRTIRTPSWHQRVLFRIIQLLFTRTQNPTTIAHLQHLWRIIYAPRCYQYIFGHFYVQKYLQPAPNMRWEKYPDHQYVSFVRNPLQRAISKYYYTQQIAHQPKADQVSIQFAKSFPTLNEFLISPSYSNIQSRHIGALPVSEYACVGVVEELEKSLFVLGSVIPALASLTLHAANQTMYKDIQEINAITPSVLTTFQTHNSQDYALYATAMAQLHSMYADISAKQKVRT